MGRYNASCKEYGGSPKGKKTPIPWSQNSKTLYFIYLWSVEHVLDNDEEILFRQQREYTEQFWSIKKYEPLVELLQKGFPNEKESMWDRARNNHLHCGIEYINKPFKIYFSFIIKQRFYNAYHQSNGKRKTWGKSTEHPDNWDIKKSLGKAEGQRIYTLWKASK